MLQGIQAVLAKTTALVHLTGWQKPSDVITAVQVHFQLLTPPSESSAWSRATASVRYKGGWSFDAMVMAMATNSLT
jgi:hypothetical protein